MVGINAVVFSTNGQNVSGRGISDAGGRIVLDRCGCDLLAISENANLGKSDDENGGFVIRVGDPAGLAVRPNDGTASGVLLTLRATAGSGGGILT